MLFLRLENSIVLKAMVGVDGICRQKPAIWAYFQDLAVTLPETNSSYLKMDGWKTIVSFWETLFSGAMLVSGRVI